MVWFLARRHLRRARSRTLLVVAGVTIAGALLFAMSMLSGGLERSFAAVLGRLGYEIRVALTGTLPGSTEAVIPDAGRIAGAIGAQPGVAWASAILATNLYVASPRGRVSAVALGLQPEVEGIVETPTGMGPGAGLIINSELAERLGVEAGDAVTVATRISPQTGAPERSAELRVAGIGEFIFDLRAQRTLALPLSALQRLLGAAGAPASFLVVKVAPGADVDTVVRAIEARFPTLDALSITMLVDEARRQLTYFNHFAAILSAVSLVVTLLLIGTVVTLAVGERLGELAALRALGLRRSRVVLLILLEGVVVAAASAPLALLLGAAVSRPLDAILRATPGVPADLHFFVFTPRAIAQTVLLLLGTGTLGAAYPAWIAARLNISATLHAEAQ